MPESSQTALVSPRKALLPALPHAAQHVAFSWGDVPDKAVAPTKGCFTRFSSSTLLPFFFLGSLIQNSRKKGTLIIKGVLGNLVYRVESKGWVLIGPETKDWGRIWSETPT